MKQQMQLLESAVQFHAGVLCKVLLCFYTRQKLFSSEMFHKRHQKFHCEQLLDSQFFQFWTQFSRILKYNDRKLRKLC